MQVIGFATQFYTLWDMQVEPQYMTDAYGNHWHVRDHVHFFYQKNISMSLGKVQELYPNTPIREDLRGKTRDFTLRNEAQDLCPQIMKFGKYKGQDVADIADSDFGYILWLFENASSAVRTACEELAQMKAHFEKVEQDRRTAIAAHKPLSSGKHALIFENNPNKQMCDHVPFEGMDVSLQEMYCATSKISDNHTIYVLFDEVKRVDGMYPYNMAIVGGKAKRIKGKEINLNLNIIHTEVNEYCCIQYARLAA